MQRAEIAQQPWSSLRASELIAKKPNIILSRPNRTVSMCTRVLQAKFRYLESVLVCVHTLVAGVAFGGLECLDRGLDLSV